MKYINSNVVPDQNFKNRNGKGCVDFNVRRNSPDAFVNTGKKKPRIHLGHLHNICLKIFSSSAKTLTIHLSLGL